MLTNDGVKSVVNAAQKRGGKLRRLKDVPPEARGVDKVIGPAMPTARPDSQDGKLIRFAIAHSCVITPVGYKYYADSFKMFAACPCDRSRKACPCDQADTEIREQGHCRCHLFWRDYETFLKAKNI